MVNNATCRKIQRKSNQLLVDIREYKKLKMLTLNLNLKAWFKASPIQLLGSNLITCNASTTKNPVEYDFDALHQTVSDLKDSKVKISQRVRPHFSSKAESLPSQLVQNFVPVDSISAPKGHYTYMRNFKIKQGTHTIKFAPK